ncbi:MAG TPA: DUF2306 domain-containing protein, partial [Tahibacter sp.]|nr:DUF2306 domain-containing protein [Tahibacter sp.]
MSAIDAIVANVAKDTGARERRATAALGFAAAAWATVAVCGQLAFAAYVALFYGGAALRGDYAAWNKVLPHGHVAGDAFGNGVVATHLAFAVVIIVGGAIQLVPLIRRRWPRVHRWNGRAYLASAAIMALGGLVMGMTRKTVGDWTQHLAIDINALLILACAAMAWRCALARRFDAHRVWALRLFLVVGGVWFFRIGLALWLVVNRGPAGFDPQTFTGPFLTALAFAQYLVPLAVLELYLRVRRGGSIAARWA